LIAARTEIYSGAFNDAQTIDHVKYYDEILRDAYQLYQSRDQTAPHQVIHDRARAFADWAMAGHIASHQREAWYDQYAVARVDEFFRDPVGYIGSLDDANAQQGGSAAARYAVAVAYANAQQDRHADPAYLAERVANAFRHPDEATIYEQLPIDEKYTIALDPGVVAAIREADMLNNRKIFYEGIRNAALKGADSGVYVDLDSGHVDRGHFSGKAEDGRPNHYVTIAGGILSAQERELLDDRRDWGLVVSESDISEVDAALAVKVSAIVRHAMRAYSALTQPQNAGVAAAAMRPAGGSRDRQSRSEHSHNERGSGKSRHHGRRGVRR
jgi:hypothetical protein